MDTEVLTRQPFFKFREMPFALCPTRFFYDGFLSQSETIRSLQWALNQNKGILLVGGRSGSGKTTVLEEIRKSFSKECACAFLKHPPSNALSLLENILLAFKVPIQKEKPTSVGRAIGALHRFAFETGSAEAHAIVLIDEAHLLTVEALESLRLFSNLMTERKRLFSIVVAGENSLFERLKSQAMRQFRQRVFLGLQIQSPSLKEIDGYVKFHLSQAGGPNEVRFDASALSQLFQVSDGNLNKLNKAVHAALSLAMVRQVRLISEKLVREATSA